MINSEVVFCVCIVFGSRVQAFTLKHSYVARAPSNDKQYGGLKVLRVKIYMIYLGYYLYSDRQPWNYPIVLSVIVS